MYVFAFCNFLFYSLSVGERKSPGKVSLSSRKQESRRQVPRLPVKNKAQRSPESSLSMDTMGDQESSKEFSKKKSDTNRGIVL